MVKEPQTEATLDGNRKHKALELAIKGTEGLPKELAKYQPIVDRVRATPGQKLVEYKFGLTKDLLPTEFFGANVWVRGVLDLSVVRPDEAVILDWKAGKRKADMDQLKVFAMSGFSLWPYVKRIKTGYVWLQSGQLDAEVFSKSSRVEIYREFAARVHRMETSENNDDWPARPSGLCRAWCPVGATHCEHCGK